jgi:hypothetical protein
MQRNIARINQSLEWPNACAQGWKEERMCSGEEVGRAFMWLSELQWCLTCPSKPAWWLLLYLWLYQCEPQVEVLWKYSCYMLDSVKDSFYSSVLAQDTWKQNACFSTIVPICCRHPRTLHCEGPMGQTLLDLRRLSDQWTRRIVFTLLPVWSTSFQCLVSITITNFSFCTLKNSWPAVPLSPL